MFRIDRDQQRLDENELARVGQATALLLVALFTGEGTIHP